MPGHDVGDVVTDLEQLEAVVGAGALLRRPDPAFDDEGVAAVARQREQVDIVEVDRADDLAAKLVEQAPGVPIAVVAAQGLTVDVVKLVLAAGEAVGVGFVDRVELAGDERVDDKRRRRAQVEQAEIEAALLVIDRVDDQPVVTGNQVQQRAGATEFVRL